MKILKVFLCFYLLFERLWSCMHETSCTLTLFFYFTSEKNKYLNSDYYFKIKGHIYVVLKSESKCKMNEINEHNW